MTGRAGSAKPDGGRCANLPDRYAATMLAAAVTHAHPSHSAAAIGTLIVAVVLTAEIFWSAYRFRTTGRFTIVRGAMGSTSGQTERSLRIWQTILGVIVLAALVRLVVLLAG